LSHDVEKKPAMPDTIWFWTAQALRRNYMSNDDTASAGAGPKWRATIWTAALFRRFCFFGFSFARPKTKTKAAE
jgi:hypothetical protein